MNKTILLIILILFNCDNSRANLGKYRGVSYPVISSLFNNRMLLLLKLTYATDEPLDWTELNNGTGDLYRDDSGIGTTLDPPFDTFGLPKAKDLNFFIDIGEIRISSKFNAAVSSYGVIALNDIRATRNFWDRIAPVRQVYCTTIYSLGDNSCLQTSKAFPIIAQELFNGEGVKYPSNDPTAESVDGFGIFSTRYHYSGIFVRNFVTGWARENNVNVTNTRFDNNQILTGGSNIIPRNNFIPGTPDANKSSSNAPLMFPAFYVASNPAQSPLAGSTGITTGHEDMEIRPGSDPYILEVRMNFKEMLMVHSYTTLNSTIQTMVNVSDWRRPHAGEQDMGGNILTRSRIIYPETASTLRISGGTRSFTHYYTLYRFDEINFSDQLPLAATPVKDGISKIKYIAPGRYRLRCVGDISRVDGYPETLIRDTSFSVNTGFRQTIAVNLACP